jgi:hypothetical protein
MLWPLQLQTLARLFINATEGCCGSENGYCTVLFVRRGLFTGSQESDVGGFVSGSRKRKTQRTQFCSENGRKQFAQACSDRPITYFHSNGSDKQFCLNDKRLFVSVLRFLKHPSL